MSFSNVPRITGASAPPSSGGTLLDLEARTACRMFTEKMAADKRSHLALQAEDAAATKKLSRLRDHRSSARRDVGKVKVLLPSSMPPHSTPFIHTLTRCGVGSNDKPLKTFGEAVRYMEERQAIWDGDHASIQALEKEANARKGRLADGELGISRLEVDELLVQSKMADIEQALIPLKQHEAAIEEVKASVIELKRELATGGAETTCQLDSQRSQLQTLTGLAK
jgi:hypothetical protein